MDINGPLSANNTLSVTNETQIGTGVTGDDVTSLVVQLDGNDMIRVQDVSVTNRVKFSGGYGLTGVDIEDDGDLFMNGDLKVDEDVTFGGTGSGTVSVENTHWFKLKARSGSAGPSSTCTPTSNKGVIIFWEDSGGTNTGFYGCDGSGWNKF